MNLRRQLLLVSLLILVLPWAGCQFIRETESALREGQQQMLSGTAQAIADSLSQFHEHFPTHAGQGRLGATQLYGHPVSRPPIIDGYFDDWPLERESMRELRGTDGNIKFILGVDTQYVYLFVDAIDSSVIYRNARPDDAFARYSDRVSLVSADAQEQIASFDFEPEAPGPIFPRRKAQGTVRDELEVLARWQDTVLGYRLEARFKRNLLAERPRDERLGLVVSNTASAENRGIRSASFSGDVPPRFVTPSTALQSFADDYAQKGMRLIITDLSGWRLALAGTLSGDLHVADEGEPSAWMRRAYAALLEPGDEPELVVPDLSGREQQSYIDEALAKRTATDWFRNPDTGRAVVVVAGPVFSGAVHTGAVVLQHDTDAIQSLTNAALARLISFTVIATVIAAIALLGYASWLSLRIRRLSSAAERALDDA